MLTTTVPRFESEIHQAQLETTARHAIGAMLQAYGLSPSRLAMMARCPRERADIQELARVMARNLLDQERVARVCTPDPLMLIGTHRTL